MAFRIVVFDLQWGQINNLEPLAPAEGMQMYLNERHHELADGTIQTHRYYLKQFVQRGGVEVWNAISRNS